MVEFKDVLGAGEISNKSVELIKLIYPDLLQPAFKKIGSALEDVIALSNTILLPIKLLNEKSSISFNNNMKKYEEKLSKISEEEIIPILSDIGLPILDRLTYLENEDISELFINLLVNASLRGKSEHAHPTFFSTLNNLSVDEARIIKYLYDSEKRSIPFINFDVQLPGKDYKAINIMKNITNLNNDITLINPNRLVFYVANLIKLGILTETKVQADDENEYYILEALYTPVIDKVSKNYGFEEHELECVYGSYQITDFGEEFIQVCNNISTKNVDVS